MTGAVDTPVVVERLTADSLRGLGGVVAPEGPSRLINGGAGRKWDHVVPSESLPSPVNVGLLRSEPGSLELRAVERHLHTAQFFLPTGPGPYVLVVAGNHPDAPQTEDVRAFLADSVGVWWAPGTWHSPLLPVAAALLFLTAMRHADPPDLDLRELPSPLPLLLPESLTAEGA
ncbi:ureidoglycolate lyase [Spiractinospora alimapuensis]|uniref:ureidoglycolate lyase n=1 Tax=Spiractinospora alimapuensis TaxID=2820884 RepID=UPI001F2B526D|nr:ureidoglycolate lyase [Spiractinospora alimapuensis]QVQ51380.1 ureidoglycolate lyase [Spiractinospora alimapuensis]